MPIGRSRTAGGVAADRRVGEAGPGRDRSPVPRFDVTPPNRHVEGHVEAMALYAGTGVGNVREVRSAYAVVRELVSQPS